VDSASIVLEGALELKALLAEYPRKVSEAAARKGLMKAAIRFRKTLRHMAPAQTGRLRKALGISKVKTANKLNPILKVGLRKIPGEVVTFKGGSQVRYYYKTLEFDSARGKALRPFFQGAWDMNKDMIAQMIVDETRKAVYAEAARIHRRSLGIKNRRR
jgi:hypothetical protein